jgi:hypothetical protein
MPGQAFEDGGADVVGVHHFGHGSPGHTRYVAEVIQNEHRCGQDQFLPRNSLPYTFFLLNVDMELNKNR